MFDQCRSALELRLLEHAGGELAWYTHDRVCGFRRLEREEKVGDVGWPSGRNESRQVLRAGRPGGATG